MTKNILKAIKLCDDIFHQMDFHQNFRNSQLNGICFPISSKNTRTFLVKTDKLECAASNGNRYPPYPQVMATAISQ